MVRCLLPLLFTVSATAVTNLFVSSYDGNVTSLSLGISGTTRLLSKSYAAAVCGAQPSWLTFDQASRTLYCLDEAWNGLNGTLTSNTVATNGELTNVGKSSTIPGSVSGVFYNTNKGRGYAVAQYGGSSFSAFQITKQGMTRIQHWTWNLTKPGANPSRQDAPHPHEAIIDPTSKYIIVPDLGADLIRVFGISNDTLELKELTSLATEAGLGPRHATFWVSPTKDTFLFLVIELTNQVKSYKVTYATSGLSFAIVATYSTFGNYTDPKCGGAAEIAVAPDNKWIVLSNRNDSTFVLPNGINATTPGERSDSLATFSIKDNGTLAFYQLAPAGGSFPRHFSFNKNGDVMAVALQQSSRIVLINRDWMGGKIGAIAASIPVSGEVNCVVWDEQ